MKRSLLIIMETLGGGGAEKVLTVLLKKLNYSKYKVELLLVIYEGIYLNEIPNEVKIKYLFKNKLVYRIFKKLSILFRTDLFFKTIINLKINTTHDLEISFMQGVTLKIHSLLKTEAKKITWVHMDLTMEKYLNNPFFAHPEANKAYCKMDKIVFVSNDALKIFNTIFNVSCEKIVFYNPINKQDILLKSQEEVILKSKLTICSIGRLVPYKALEKLIRVAKRLSDIGIDFKIWIIGEGKSEEILKKMANEFSLDNKIEFLGYKKNPYPYLKAADIFISTSLSEGFSLVVAEAICLGKTIISTRVTGPRELLDDGKYGILTGHTEDEIFNALKEVLENDHLRKTYENMALERSAIFDIDKSIKEFERIIS